MPYRLYVFGSNGEGQLGIPAQDIVNTPAIANSWPPQESINTVCGGDNHALILTNSGQVWGAGSNKKGQLGLSNREQSRTEDFVKLRDGVSFIAATCESSAFITNSERTTNAHSTMESVGANHWGELALTFTAERPILDGNCAESFLHRSITDFAAGAWHYVALDFCGEVYGWGKSRLEQLGSALAPQQRITTPTQIPEASLPGAPVKVVCGKDFTYIANIYAYGSHILLGRDKFGIRSKMPANIKDWKDIGATWYAIFVLFRDGTMAAWGKDDMWKLIPEGLPPIDKIAVGSEHVLALKPDGRLISWGWGKHGNCGDLTNLEREGKVKNDMVSNCWNEITIPGKIKFIGAGFCTSFVLTDIEDQEDREEQ
ncbi:RCC1/BLIP-II [Lentithecium fluviatile CBS 122367]|uniref:RCC1/BLIP-II n=1 Tax=Lentithecium fluviatile CBS 122367 TaxID=1168545 RepID=A0A6G1J8Y8_9PLEO|nr:RCC1/BLIP-II [Lentithecium fluviatile CBS 122367]